MKFMYILIGIICLFKNIHCIPVQEHDDINIKSLDSLSYHQSVSPKFIFNTIFELFNNIVRDALFNVNNVLASIEYPFNDSSVTLKLIEGDAKIKLNEIVKNVQQNIIIIDSQFQENINCTLDYYGEIENIIRNGNETILNCISNATKEIDNIRNRIEHYTNQLNEIVTSASKVVSNCIQMNNFFQQISCIITSANDVAIQIGDLIPKISASLQNTFVDLNMAINNTSYCVTGVIETVRIEINGIIQDIQICMNGTMI